MTDIEGVAYATVHDYPGGAIALGAQTGINGQVLINKTNPNDTRHHLMLKEAVRIQVVSGDHRILHAMADELGYVCIIKPDAPVCGDVPHALMSMCAEFGDYLRTVDEAMRDGRVTTNERRTLKRELCDLIAAATRLQSIVAAQT